MTVVAAVDEDTDREILLEAEQLAIDRDHELHVVHVMSESEFRELEEASIAETNHPIDLDTIRDQAASTADKIASGNVSKYNAVGLEGEEASRIVQYLSEIDASYVVLGVRKMSPVGKAMFGSTAQSILLNSECPVLSVRTS